VRDALREIGALYELEPDDIKSTSMGVTGVDVILTPAARKIFNFDIECKQVEALNVFTTFKKHFLKYVSRPTIKLLFHGKNKEMTQVTMEFEQFMGLVTELVALRKNGSVTNAN
jgi:hypothetical protein